MESLKDRKYTHAYSVISNSLRPHGLWPTRLHKAQVVSSNNKKLTQQVTGIRIDNQSDRIMAQKQTSICIKAFYNNENNERMEC